jgi:hypothetical protein
MRKKVASSCIGKAVGFYPRACPPMNGGEEGPSKLKDGRREGVKLNYRTGSGTAPGSVLSGGAACDQSIFFPSPYRVLAQSQWSSGPSLLKPAELNSAGS